MEKKIRKNILVVSVLTAIITFVFSSVSFYLTMMASLDQEIKEISSKIISVLEEDPYALNSMDFFSESRMTVISEEGVVLFDSIKDLSTLENHSGRPEIIQAQNKGIGRSLRYSTSLSSQTYYVAYRLTNGNYLRISSQTHSFNSLFISGLVVSAVALLLMLMVTVLAARKLTKNIIRPINEIDFSAPLENKTYPELRPLLENMDKHDKMRKEFSANVSHELKTPLTSISGYAEIMANGLVKNEDIPAFSQKIYHESQNLFHRIEDIIRISKLDEAHLPKETEDVNYQAVIESILEHLKPQIESKNIQIQTELSNITGKGLVSVVEEIFYNLIENAVKYNQNNGHINLKLFEEDNKIHVIIQDTGIGIAKEDLPRIYERFFRSDRSHSQQIEGSGLGLSIVKHGLALLGGEIHVESKINQGTCFSVTLNKS